MRDKIQAKVAKAFNAKLADAIHTFTCQRITQSNWDPVTEESIQTTLEYSGRGALFGSYNQYEVINLGVLASDSKAIVLQNEVDAEPKVDDEWLTERGLFRVVYIKPDAVGASFTVQLRKV
ncbi:glutamate 5-kinase [Acinetobacter gerneri]|uniref:glutamate 5-kinase n=1 Tax=Acinetobacter gerneri TaxID=202952 RepID=UPI0028B0D181|nr:glutamate 5-kinase [Acinetobacter gerneri]